jgi:hypothetical protein
MSLSKAPPLNDTEFSAAFRDQATDEDIEAVLRHLIFWSYVMRDPFGRVCAVGRGTRSECIENAFRLADDYAIENFSLIEDPQHETRALNGPWRLVLWPPKLDPDPPFWAASADVFGDQP